MQTLIEIALLLPLIALVGGSLLNISSHPHWFVRGWDFPRVQIVLIGWFCTMLAMFSKWGFGNNGFVPTWLFIVPTLGLTLWHGFRIIPYTPVYPKQAKPTRRSVRRSHLEDPATVRVVVSNLEMENEQHDLWLNVMGDADPDILVALEVDEKWTVAVSSLFDRYPHRIVHPQDNWYGMMLLSRLPIASYRLRFLVEDDIPSMDTEIELDDGQIIRFIAVHPRPPEPWRDNDATARDAEITLWGDELIDETRPTIIGGDLNDVAWSATTRLFLRTSRMLDPRRGRGFFNTFHANHWCCRYPLDHIFHSAHFTVSRIERMPHIGSDHFPMLIDLRLEPQRKGEHEILGEKPGDEAEVDLRVDRAKEDETVEGEAVSRQQPRDVATHR